MRTILMLAFGSVSAAPATSDYAVAVSAEVQASPAQIKLSWAQDTFAVPTAYTVYRKAPEATSWSVVVTLPGAATSFIDTNVTAQADYEYQIEKTAAGYSGYGYIWAGIEAPLAEFRGKVILIVENMHAAELAGELAQLQQDLTGDGWQVLRHDVSRNDSVNNVKALIQVDYNADPNSVRAVFLFGRVPVAYSGDIAPDGHVPDHQGAWPADMYYGDMDGTWTDNAVNCTVAHGARNWNVPGDGKFDQSALPLGVELEVGRVDLSDLPSFPQSEKELLRQYLNKNHKFRHKQMTAERRGLIQDSFGAFGSSAFAASGWRNFAAFFGGSNITAIAPGTWFSTLNTESYLWAYGCGGGTYTSAGGVGTTADYAANDPKAVFNLLFGSYFGDWDSTDNLMRASLATSTYGLACAWAGRPHWFLHHMGLGETIGYGARLSQNNGYGGLYKPAAAGNLQVHVALMGDPTLRLHPVAPPTSVNGAVNANEVALNWTESAEPVLGYFVYRAPSAAGPFTRLTPTLIAASTFSDTSPAAASYIYMVRAIKLERAASGSYYNASQGAFCSVSGIVVSVSAPIGLTAHAINSSQIKLSWTDNSANEENFIVARSLATGGPYSDIATLPANSTSFVDTGLSPESKYFYVIRAVCAAATPAYSSEASATTQPVLTTPGAPGNLTAAVVSRAQINLAWKDNSSNEVTFTLERRKGGAAYVVIATLAAKSTSFSDTTVARNTSYTYRVKAGNAAGNSAYSNTATVKTLR